MSEPKGPQRTAKGSPKAPNWSPRAPNGSQREPKVRPKEATWDKIEFTQRIHEKYTMVIRPKRNLSFIQ